MARTPKGLPRPTPPTPLATVGRRLRAESAGGRLRGRTLVLARGVWLAVAALTVGLYAAGVWVWIGQLRGHCLPGLCVHGQVPTAVQHAFAALHLSVGFYGWYNLGLNVVFAVGFAAVAALLFWRRSSDPVVLFASLALLVFGVASFEGGFLAAGLPAVSPGWRLPVRLLGLLGELAFGLFVALFPDGRFVPRWTRLVVVALLLWWGPDVLVPGSPLDFNTWPGVAYFGGWAALLGAMATAQVYRYRHVSTPAQQQQTKWVVYGFVAAALGYLAGQVVVFFWVPMQASGPTLTSPAQIRANLAGFTLAYASILLVPISIGIAMLRSRLYDIDVIIRQTLVYGTVTGALALVYIASILAAQAVVQATWGRQPLPPAVVVVSTLLVAALFNPLRGRLQLAIDRRFYRRRYDAARTVAAFGQSLRSDVDLARVTGHLLATVEETMRPSHVSLWLMRPPPAGDVSAGQRAEAAEAGAGPVLQPAPPLGPFIVPHDPAR